MNELIRKGFETKAELTDNRIRGAASVTGVMDRTGDVIYPGAFKKAIPGFLKSGFIADGHNWEDMAKLLGRPVAAKEVGSELQVEAEFHSTDHAQTVRAICKERMEGGQTVAFSIGFWPGESAWFDSGKQLLADAEAKGCDMALFDGAVGRYKGPCRGIAEVRELAEWSIVTVPANPKALAADVKAAYDSLTDGSLAGLSFEDHLDSVLAAVVGASSRYADVREKREEEGRMVSRERRQQLEAIQKALTALLEEPEPSPEIDVDALAARRLALRARLIGR